MIDVKELAKNMLEIAKETEAFLPIDLVWIETILNRSDKQNGIDQLRPLIIACDEYNQKKKDLSVFQRNLQEYTLQSQLFTAKSLYYVQPKVMICVPQRKKHPKFTAPCLANFISGQPYRCEVECVYGLSYTDARTYFVDKALADGTYTHLFFIDDDILVPLDSLTKLLGTNEPIIGLNYVKRNPLLESVATTILPDNGPSIFRNFSVEPGINNNEPVIVNATGLGATLFDIQVFRQLPKPWFEFIFEKQPNGENGKLIIGEDSNFLQKCLIQGLKPKIIPNLYGIHVNFSDGACYSHPDIVDLVTRKIRPEWEDKYCKFACDTRELYSKDLPGSPFLDRV